MTRAVKVVTFIYIVFIITLVLSGTLGGIVGEMVYYSAFMIPIAIGFYSSKSLKYEREEIAGVAEAPDTLLDVKRFDFKRLIPLIAPTVTVVFLISLITSLVFALFGVSTPAVEQRNVFLMILLHALVPAVLEELLFRYIPMKLLLPYSKRWCILYSAICFALIHCSFLQIPYAFAAGVIFMAIDVAMGSVWPSLILHLVNNTASIIWIKYCSGMTASVIFISVMLILSIVSFLFVYKKRDAYKKMFIGVFDKGDGFAVTYAPVALILITCYLASLNLFS